MYIDDINIPGETNTIEDKLKRYDIIKVEANTVRNNDKTVIRSLFKNFYNKQLSIGIGFQRAYGSILSGDYFDLIKLPDGNYFFIFADISGHGLPAYTTLIRLRSAITIAIKRIGRIYKKVGGINSSFLVNDICTKFTDIMDESNTNDFASVNFIFIYNDDDRFNMKFYNRSMLFPIVLRRLNESSVKLINLNYKTDDWTPCSGFHLGSNMRALLNDKYLDTPFCDFILQENDSILFFSDGITEAYNPEMGKNLTGNEYNDEFGEKRVEDLLIKNSGLKPQELINELFNSVYNFIGHPDRQKDDMTAVLIGFSLDKTG